MVGANLKSETMKLMEKRSRIEAEMNTIIEQLCQPGEPGLAGNLVDSEGFPRADIDVPFVRAQRHRLAGVETNQNASVVGVAASVSLQNLALRDSQGANEADLISGVPFAIVDEIADASPAAEDGLQLGDQIVKFGNVKAGYNLLQRLASESQVNQGRPILVTIMRQGAMINVSVTPRTWQGRGLLGCHFHIM